MISHLFYIHHPTHSGLCLLGKQKVEINKAEKNVLCREKCITANWKPKRHKSDFVDSIRSKLTVSINEVTHVISGFDTMQVKSAYLWVIAQRMVIISCSHFGTTYRFYCQGSRNPRLPLEDFLTLENGTDMFSETSVRNYHYTLRNNPLEQISTKL